MIEKIDIIRLAAIGLIPSIVIYIGTVCFKISNRAMRLLKRSETLLKRIRMRLFRNSWINKGRYWKMFDATLYPKNDRPKIYIQRYGRNSN